MKQVKTQKGITLIALIITVIVMLILAGVAINMTIGDNGIFRKSQEGAEVYKNSANNEATSLNGMDKELGDLINQIESDNKGNLDNSTEIADVVQAGTNLYALTTSGELRETIIEPGNLLGKIKLGKVVQGFEGKKIVKVVNDVYDGIEYMALDYTGKAYVNTTNEGIQCLNETGNPKIIDIKKSNDSVIMKMNENIDVLPRNSSNFSTMNIQELQGKTITDVYVGTYGMEDSSPTYIARDNTGKLYAWGRNDWGQLGNGTTIDSDVPICISDTGALEGINIVDVSIDDRTVVARDNTGKLYIWGKGSGKNPTNVSDTGILKDVNIVESRLNEGTLIARDNTGKIYWGKGLGEPICLSDEIEELKNKNIIEIVINYGEDNILLKDNNGKVYGRGANWQGQLTGTQSEEIDSINISDIPNSELNNKKVKKIVRGGKMGQYGPTDSYIVYITEEGAYIYQYTIIYMT